MLLAERAENDGMVPSCAGILRHGFPFDVIRVLRTYHDAPVDEDPLEQGAVEVAREEVFAVACGPVLGRLHGHHARCDVESDAWAVLVGVREEAGRHGEAVGVAGG